MPFRNPILRGLELIRAAIRSDNYVAGTSGWSINRDGTAEFTNAVVSSSFATGVSPNERLVINDPNYGPASILYVPSGSVLANRRSSIHFGNAGVPDADLNITAGDGTSATAVSERFTASDRRIELITEGATGKIIFRPGSWIGTTAPLERIDTSIGPDSREAWHNIALPAAMTAVAGWDVPGYMMDATGRVWFRGACNLAANTPAAVQFTLPAPYQPVTKKGLYFAYGNAPAIVGHLRLDVATNGQCSTLVASPAATVFILFDLMSFPTVI